MADLATLILGAFALWGMQPQANIEFRMQEPDWAQCGVLAWLAIREE